MYVLEKKIIAQFGLNQFPNWFQLQTYYPSQYIGLSVVSWHCSLPSFKSASPVHSPDADCQRPLSSISFDPPVYIRINLVAPLSISNKYNVCTQIFDLYEGLCVGVQSKKVYFKCHTSTSVLYQVVIEHLGVLIG